MAAPKHAWRGFNRVNGSDIGAKAIRVYICTSCGVWHERNKPVQCIGCGMMVFDIFDSKTEAKRWAALGQQERMGLISDLRRQVKFPLLTIGKQGLATEFAYYLADFVYIQDGERVIEDSKGGGVSPDARLKLACMQSMGLTVRLTK